MRLLLVCLCSWLFVSLCLLRAEGFAFPVSHSACLNNAAASVPHLSFGITQTGARTKMRPLAKTLVPGSPWLIFLPPSPFTSMKQPAVVRFLASRPTGEISHDRNNEDNEQNQENGQLGAAESKLEGKLETAKEELVAANQDMEAAEGRLEAAEGRLEAATDPQQKGLAQKACDRAETAYNLAVENVNTARRAVNIALDAVQRAGAAGSSEVQIQPTRRRSRPREPFWNLLRREVESLLGADRERIAEWQRVYFTSMLAPATAWQGAEGRQKLLALMEYSSLAIIDDPQKKLSKEPFSFPAGDISRVVSNSLAQEPARKELVCVVRGTGTGKTRLLEETRLQLLRDRSGDRVRIPLAVTFNGRTNLKMGEMEGAVAQLTIDARTTLAIGLRVAANTYNWKLAVVKRAAQAVLETSDFSRIMAEEIMKDLLMMIVADLAALHGSNKIDIVLIVDETLRLQRLFENLQPDGRAPQEEHVCSSVFDAFDLLDPDVRTSLVVSSLQFVSQFSTNSGRRVVRLPMADRLSVSDITERWWRVDAMSERIESGRERRDNLKASTGGLAAALCNLPRAVEAVGFKIDEWLAQPQDIVWMPQELCRSMWMEAETVLVTRYSPTILQPDFLFPALFSRPVPTTNPKVAASIESSLYVNTPDPNLNDIVPEVNLAYVSAAARNNLYAAARALRELPKMPGSPFRTVDEGDPLEFALVRMLLVRMVVAVLGVRVWSVDANPLLWTEVLTGFQGDRLTLGKVAVDEDFSLVITTAVELSLSDLADDTRAISRSTNLDAFFASFDKIREPCFVPRVARGEAFDILVLLEPPGSDPCAVFYECKAIFDVEQELTAKQTEAKLGEFNQLRRVARVVEAAKAMPEDPANKMICALKAERWHYVYATTLPQNSTVLVPPEFKKHCSVMLLEELQTVLGPAFPLFDAFWRSIRQQQLL